MEPEGPLHPGLSLISQATFRQDMQSRIMHVQGIANRDLKLENLLLDRDGRDGTRPLLKICDFGYSKHEMNSSAKTGVGTPVYMAPEVILGEAKYDAKVGHMTSLQKLA